jgi:hypothetical protein
MRCLNILILDKFLDSNINCPEKRWEGQRKIGALSHFIKRGFMLISKSFISIILILIQTPSPQPPYCIHIGLIPYANIMHPGGGDIHIDLLQPVSQHLLPQNNHGQRKGFGVTRVYFSHKADLLDII